jgi:hypothetical protein
MVEVTVPIYYKQNKKKTSLMGLNWYRNAHYLTSNNANIIVSDSSEYHYDKKFPRAEITLTKK